MKTINVKAIFRGQDGSCGFSINREYTLQIFHQKAFLHVEDLYNDAKMCEYESVISFLENWDNIRRI